MADAIDPPGYQRADAGHPGSVTVWYIRHGHNPANQAHQMSYKVIDYPLTDLGITQATTLARRLAREPAPAAIYSSPLRRATQTAVIIVQHVGGEVTVIEDLRELNVGDLDGRRVALQHPPPTCTTARSPNWNSSRIPTASRAP